jgi:hypothetical protein
MTPPEAKNIIQSLIFMNENFKQSIFSEQVYQALLLASDALDKLTKQEQSNNILPNKEDLKTPLHCLVYTSMASQKMSDDNLKYFLQVIRHKNQLRQVTGMLLYLDPFFIQALEGEEAVINQLFDVIKKDSRHNKVSLVYKKPIPERHFANWTMGFSKISYEDIETLDGFSEFLQKPSIEFFNRSGNEVDELLYKFKYEILF